MSAALLPTNPRRPTDWRWQRACQLAETGTSPNRKRDDQWVVHARKFKDRLDRAGSEVQQAALAENQPSLYFAHEMYAAGREDAMRNELEARLLSNQATLGIARRMGLSHDCIDSYERMFYSVRDRLRTPAYILHVAIGPAVQNGLSEREYDMLWKWYGYTYGPILLDALINQASDPQHPHDPSQVDSAFRDDGVSSIIRKQAIAARTIPVDRRNRLELLHIYAKFVEIEKMAGEDAAAAQNTIFANIEAAMNFMPICVENSADVDQANAVSYHSGGAELRTQELLDSSIGKTPVLGALPHFPEGSEDDRTTDEQGS